MLSDYKYVGCVLKGKGSPEDGKLEEMGATSMYMLQKDFKYCRLRIEGVCLYRTISSNSTWQA